MPTPQVPPQQQPRQQSTPGQQANPAQQADPQGGRQQTPVAPTSPGGGALRQPLFSGDHVLETIARGQGVLRAGARGPSVRAIQQFLMAQGLNVGATGPDGIWGGATTKAVQGWQKSRGLSSDGIIGKNTLTAMDAEPLVTNPPTSATPGTSPAPQPQPTRTQSGPPAANQQPGGANRASNGAPGSRNGGLPDDFQKMWDAHPHNYLPDASQNTSSEKMAEWLGYDISIYTNSCAIRLSTMFNQLGGKYTITKEKAVAAGIPANRVAYSRKTGWYYLLAAREAWEYVTKHFGQPHAAWPANRRFRSEDEYRQAFDKDIEPAVSGKKGIVAFDKIFGYSGTGHVDIFDGMQLSDANSWYPCQQLKVWYV